MSAKRIDIVVLVLLSVLTGFYISLTKNLFIGKVIFPSSLLAISSVLYMGWRQKKHWKKIGAGVLLFGVLCGFIFEFFQEFNGSYHIVSRIFPKIFGVVPLDNIFGHALMTLFTLVFYEHFVNRKPTPRISQKISFAWIPLTSVAALIIIFFYVKPEWLVLKYSYFYLGMAAIVPPLFLAVTKSNLIRDMAMTAIFFFFLYFAGEIYAVKLNWWIYPGNNYIGQVTVAGVTYPFEELFFWMMFYAASLVSYYKIFIDSD